MSWHMQGGVLQLVASCQDSIQEWSCTLIQCLIGFKYTFSTAVTCSGWPGHTSSCLEGEGMSAVHVLLQVGRSRTWVRTARDQLRTETAGTNTDTDCFLGVDQLCSPHTDEPRPSNTQGPFNMGRRASSKGHNKILLSNPMSHWQ